MKPDVIGSWIFGGAVLALVLVLHGLAFRIGEKSRRNRATRAGGHGASKTNGHRTAEDRRLSGVPRGNADFS